MAARNAIPIGAKFGALTILCEAPKRPQNANRRVSALCDCGNAKTFVLSEVLTGKIRSCGCLTKKTGQITHGHTLRRKASPEYYSWASMLTRCTNPAVIAYQTYGARGVTVCDRWRMFSNFLEDMGKRPPDTSLDRIDNNGGYSKENCRWASRKQQSENRRSTKFFEVNGQRMTLSDLSSQFGIAYNTLHARIVRFKWPIEIALTKKPRISRYTKSYPR